MFVSQTNYQMYLQDREYKLSQYMHYLADMYQVHKLDRYTQLGIYQGDKE